MCVCVCVRVCVCMCVCTRDYIHHAVFSSGFEVPGQERMSRPKGGRSVQLRETAFESERL